MGENFAALAEWLGRYGYPLLFGVVLAENAGLPVPGETAVLAAGVVAGRPNPPLSIVWVIIVVFVAAVVGDNLGFWLGRRWARRRLEQGKRFLFLTPKTLRSVEGYFEHYGTLTIFFARFVAGLRVVAALAAGTSRMTWPRFLIANAAGAVAWSTCMSLLGYFFGQSWEMLHKWLGRGGLLILGCVVVLVVLPFLWRRLRRLPAGSWDRLLRSQIWQSILAAVLVVVCVTVLLMLADRRAARPVQDTKVGKWVADRQGTWLDNVAAGGSFLGSLPVTAGVTGLLLFWLWHGRWPWRESVALLWALVASEGIGLLLLALLRHKGIEPGQALVWPFGFAGLEPMRGVAVYGMAAHLLGLQKPARGVLAGILALPLILLIGFGVVWSGHYLTEVLVEYAAGALVLFLGMWWLEGYGLGPWPGPAEPGEPGALATGGADGLPPVAHAPGSPNSGR